MIEKTTTSRILFNIFNYTFMILLSIACIAPIWHVLAASFSDPQSLMASRGLLLKPTGDITLEGYKLVFKNHNILTGYMNTIIYVIASTALGTLLTILAGYVISRNELKLKGPITALILFTMMFNGGLIPTYMVIKHLGLIGTRGALIIPGVINAFYIIIMKSSFEQLSPGYEESAKLDGAGPFTIMTRILVPLVKSTVAVVVVFTIVLQWNSWFPASIYVPTKRALWPLQLVMREILVQNDTAATVSGSDANARADLVKNLVKYCTIVVGTLPVLCTYPFAQKYFVQGVTLGGVKG